MWTVLLCIVALLIAGFAFYQMIFGGSDKPQDSRPEDFVGGIGHGGMGQ